MEVPWLHLIPLLPLVDAAINGLAGRWIPKAWVYAVALLVVLLSFLMGVFAWVHVARLDGEAAQLRELVYTWFSVGSLDRKSTRLNSSHQIISYAVFCLKK